MTDQATFDDLLGEAVLPVLTVWRGHGTTCGWCLRDCGGQFAGSTHTWDESGLPIDTSVCMPCRDEHGLNAHLHAIRDGRYKIGDQP
ncbi:hypothetical protein [Citricoccus sp. NR2]|uniref:hypothetical protein n=1 Tax=Citricoccus sp. NR2 TaxID=3004095 RepID=UPI0022DDA937|nr:hypothetical protein [Citricoccus sp. NR2]WBL18484.1 hypothetical protein O1A05_12050 [Citricoccus sp. NR2]